MLKKSEIHHFIIFCNVTVKFELSFAAMTILSIIDRIKHIKQTFEIMNIAFVLKKAMHCRGPYF